MRSTISAGLIGLRMAVVIGHVNVMSAVMRRHFEALLVGIKRHIDALSAVRRRHFDALFVGIRRHFDTRLSAAIEKRKEATGA